MPSLMTIVGTCLAAAAAAGQSIESHQGVPQEVGINGANPAGMRTAAVPDGPSWWSNSTAADALAGSAGTAKAGSAVADDTQPRAAAAHSVVRAEDATETAPGPPSKEPTRNAAFAELPTSERPPERSVHAGTISPAPVRLASSTDVLDAQAKKDQPPPTDGAASKRLRPPLANLPAFASNVPRAIADGPDSCAAPAERGGKNGTVPLIATSAAAPSLPLGGRGDKTAAGNTSPLETLLTVGGSLSVVLGLFLVVAWAMRKTAPRGSLVLPKEVFEILGRAPLGARQQVQLLRCGSKLLLVSITPQGTETLTEVTDPLEVDRIAGICQQGNPKSSTAAFRQVFQQVASAPGKLAADDEPQIGGPRRKRYRWEEKHA